MCYTIYLARTLFTSHKFSLLSSTKMHTNYFRCYTHSPTSTGACVVYIYAIVHDILMKTCTKLLELCSFESLLLVCWCVRVCCSNVDKIKQKQIIQRFHSIPYLRCCCSSCCHLNCTYLSHVKLLTVFSLLFVFPSRSHRPKLLKNNHFGNIFNVQW